MLDSLLSICRSQICLAKELESLGGRQDEAAALLAAAEPLLRQADEVWRLLGLLCQRAACEAKAGDAAQARETLAEARALHTKLMGEEPSMFSPQLRQLTATLGASAIR